MNREVRGEWNRCEDGLERGRRRWFSKSANLQICDKYTQGSFFWCGCWEGRKESGDERWRGLGVDFLRLWGWFVWKYFNSSVTKNSFHILLYILLIIYMNVSRIKDPLRVFTTDLQICRLGTWKEMGVLVAHQAAFSSNFDCIEEVWVFERPEEKISDQEVWTCSAIGFRTSCTPYHIKFKLTRKTILLFYLVIYLLGSCVLLSWAETQSGGSPRDSLRLSNLRGQ